jgi:hypothetical protein
MAAQKKIKKATKNGARRVVATLDSLASLFQNHGASLGIPSKVAMDFALRCDMLSDALDRGLKTAGYFDPSTIAVKKPGPKQFDPNNPFMKGHFTQEKFTGLSAKQESGALAQNAAQHAADPKMAALIQRKAAELSLLLAGGRVADGDEGETDAEAEELLAEMESEEAAKKTASARRRAALKRRAEEAKEDAEEAKEDAEEAKEDAAKEADDEEAEEGDAEEGKKAAAQFGLFS